MTWYNDLTWDSVVISTRARIARNVEDYPFDLTASDAVRNELTERVKSALTDAYAVADMKNVSPADRRALLDGHFISPDFMQNANGLLLSNEEQGVYIMTPEEDHIRLQVLGKGYCSEKVLETANSVLDLLSDKLKFSFDAHLGYLTRCPTNLGHGLRLSVMAFLPGLSANSDIARLADSLSGLGFNLRGMYGEGTRSGGCLYQISNRSSLGVSISDILSSFSSVVRRITEAEERARAMLAREEIADQAGRAYGILAYAGKLSYDEFLNHYASLRLGYALSVQDLTDRCHPGVLDSLLVTLAPGMITNAYHTENSSERDRARAKELKKKLRGD